MESEVCCKVKADARLLVFPQDQPRPPTTSSEFRGASVTLLRLDVVLSLSLDRSCSHQNVAEVTSEAGPGQAHWKAGWAGSCPLVELPPGGGAAVSGPITEPSSQSQAEASVS